MTAPDLRTRRQALGLSARAYARLCGLARTTVERRERGEVAVPLEALRLLEALEAMPPRDRARWMLARLPPS